MKSSGKSYLYLVMLSPFSNIVLINSQAFETKSNLNAQRSMLGNSGGGLTSLTSNVPGIGKLIEGIQKKKYKESLTIALVIAVLLCFTVW